MDFSKRLASEATAVNDHHECDHPDCGCQQDAGDLPGDGAAEVTMTEVYGIDIPWGHHPSGW